MYGYRLWDFFYDENKKVPALQAVGTVFIWQGNVVGEKLDYLAITNSEYEFYDPETELWYPYASDSDMERIIPELGFWAFNDIITPIVEADNYDSSFLLGKVNGFGKIHVHQHGFRSEYMQILGFLDTIECNHPIWVDDERLPCSEQGDYVVITEYTNKIFCREHYDNTNLNRFNIHAQYTKDKFFQELCPVYGVGRHSFAELRKLGEE